MSQSQPEQAQQQRIRRPNSCVRLCMTLRSRTTDEDKENIPLTSSLLPLTSEPQPSSSSQTQQSSRQYPEHGFAREDIVTLPNGKMTIHYHCNCKKYYTTRKILVNHVRTMKTGKVFECPECYKSSRFSTHRSLKKHMQNKHGSFDYKYYGCHGCGKEFDTFDDLTHHRKLSHAVVKLGKPKIGLPPSSKQPLISAFFRKK